MKPYSISFLYVSVFLCLLYHRPSKCQQQYLNNKQLDCYGSEDPTTKGSACSIGDQKTCQSFLTFRSQKPYDSVVSIAKLFNLEASSISYINNISPNLDLIPSGSLVIVPLNNCSCSDGFFQYYTSYTIQSSRETYFTVANNTYQGLTTCQALMAQDGNTSDRNFYRHTVIKVPLRCACASANQMANGTISLLAYLVTWGDSISSIAENFGVNEESILEANVLTGKDIIFPFTPILVPLQSDSCVIHPENSYCYNCPNDFPRDARLGGRSCKRNKKSPVKLVMPLGIGIGLGFLCICLSGYMLYRFLKKRRYKIRKEKRFKQNGGFLLQQRLAACSGGSERAKIFTAEELQRATDDYNQSRFLGQGAFGTVYKGMLPDGSVVAVKRSKAIDKTQIEQFINEVVILSQINHRNIVKLLGCCLETEVPVLVYEFVPNGTLYHHIHDHKKEPESSLSWEHRLRIACEVAGAIAYMHSSASSPIFHRDIKSSNILLDDKYNAKVSDFGTSRSVPNDKTHLTTAVQGTLGYLDPEYFQLSQFTEKSDVYSFGVVLLELLTGETPFSFARLEEGRNLVAQFISSAKENQLLEILDTRVAKEARKEDIQFFAELVMRCLRLNGKKRPTMKEVAMELEGLRRSQRGLEIYEEPKLLRDKISYVDSDEESRQGSTEDNLEFSPQVDCFSRIIPDDESIEN